ncbi:unnamed protein product [Rhizophagus irregularis]|nr:unnamed protein product [Rhizophagus irregularis]
MNFIIDLQLDVYDCDLPATVIFGLRIAFAFFIEDDYDMTFQVFRSKALCMPKAMTFLLLSLSLIVVRILKLYNNQKLFLYLHIDEFQVIDAWDVWDAKNTTKSPGELFKNIIRIISNT